MQKIYNNNFDLLHESMINPINIVLDINAGKEKFCGYGQLNVTEQGNWRSGYGYRSLSLSLSCLAIILTFWHDY